MNDVVAKRTPVLQPKMDVVRKKAPAPQPTQRLMMRERTVTTTPAQLDTDDPGAPGQRLSPTTTYGPWKDYPSQPIAPSKFADGGFPADEPGLPKAPSFNPGKLVTSPTQVHLNKGDAVVPLTYRPKAKIRPSAALPAIAAMQRRRPYGAARV
jgi:hypothetical protein